MATVRRIETVLESRYTMEGAGVRLRRVFANREARLMDPFLLLDHFGSANPDDYLAGFPWHPHRGIETITYMLEGEVEHGDSLGNRGTIGSGDIQWMTAGSGIIHQEMPQRYEGTLRGLQLWANLPAAQKMMSPRYRDISAAQVPEVDLGGARIKVIAGEIQGTRGAVGDIVIDPTYLDVDMPPDTSLDLPVKEDHNAFAFVLEGEGFFGGAQPVSANHLALFVDGDTVSVSTRSNPVRLIFVSGKPLREPIAWGGPIVMNTEEELEQAFREYREGTFIKS
ncbi:MAG: pirin family protein [Actinomycetota bacterium]